MKIRKIFQQNFHWKSVTLFLLFLIGIIFLETSLALWTTSNEKSGAFTIVVGDLTYTLTAKELDKDRKITVSSSNVVVFDVSIFSENDDTTLYQIYYEEEDNPNVKVSYYQNGSYTGIGTIAAKEKTSLQVVIENKSNKPVTLTFGVQGGLLNKNFTLEQGTELKDYSGDVLLAYHYIGEGQPPIAFPKKDSGYRVTKVDCLGAEGVWDNVGWSLKLSSITGQGGSSCTISFEEGYGPYVYDYTGQFQEFVAPATGYYQMETYGASGGLNQTFPETIGLGGYTKGVIYLEKGTTLYVVVGREGSKAADYLSPIVYNGGGGGGSQGGGATDIRTAFHNDQDGLKSRIIIAGGGGGGVYASASYEGTQFGHGGGLIGQSAHINAHNTSYDFSGFGGTQTAGGKNGSAYQNDIDPIYTKTMSGTFGQGGYSLSARDGNYDSSGGGGGYYGGGKGNHPGWTWPGGGGGSSYLSGYAGVNSVENKEGIIHTNQTLHYSNFYFIDGTLLQGVNRGNGKAIITYLGTSYERKNTKLNQVRYIKDCTNGNTTYEGNHWLELQAIKEGINVAFHKTITGTLPEANDTIYSFTNIVDGKIDQFTDFSGYGYMGGSGKQCITVDLENLYDLDEIAVWHWFKDNRSYHHHYLSVSSDNENFRDLISDQETKETVDGTRISAWK